MPAREATRPRDFQPRRLRRAGRRRDRQGLSVGRVFVAVLGHRSPVRVIRCGQRLGSLLRRFERDHWSAADRA